MRTSPGLSRRTGDPDPPASRAVRRYPPSSYYARVALGTVLPGAGLLRTRWKVLGWVLLLGALALAGWVARSVARGGVLEDRARHGGEHHGAAGHRRGCRGRCRPVDRVGRPHRPAGVATGAPGTVGQRAVRRPHVPRHRGTGRPRGALLHRPGRPRAGRLTSPTASAKGHTADPDEPDPWADIPRVNIALLGSDAGRDRIGVRTDSMMVVSIDTRTGDALLIGIPRNLENVPIPDGNPLSRLWPNE